MNSLSQKKIQEPLKERPPKRNISPWNFAVDLQKTFCNLLAIENVLNMLATGHDKVLQVLLQIARPQQTWEECNSLL